MGLHKPSVIPTLAELTADDEVKQVLESVPQFGTKKVNSSILQYLSETEPLYPYIPVLDRGLLLASGSTKFKGLIWIASWFEVVAAFKKDKNGKTVYSARLRINGDIVDVDYDAMYPKDVTKLAQYGLIINPDHADSVSKYILRSLVRLEVKELPDGAGFFMQEGKLAFRAYDEEPQILDYTPNITLKEYIGMLNPLITNSALMFALCCSCASLFLAFLSMVCGLPLMSFVISLYGASTTGKSTAQTLMTSLHTDPTDDKLYIPFFGTFSALLTIVSKKYGIPQLFDEATVSGDVNLEKFFYTVSNDHDKSRCSGEAELREQKKWKTIVITSSENKLLSDSEMHNAGLDARLFSFSLQFTDSAAHSDRISMFSKKYYGILGKALSEHLLSADRDKITQQYDECRDTMRSALGSLDGFRMAERLINEYATLLMAGTVLSDLGVNIDLDAVTAIMTENSRTLRIETNIAEKYYQHLLAYAAMHPYAEGIKKDETSNTAAFIDELFLRVLSDYGASNTDLVIKELDAAGYLFRRKKNSIKNRLRFNGTLVNCYEIKLPEADCASDDSCMTLEYILTHFEGVDES